MLPCTSGSGEKRRDKIGREKSEKEESGKNEREENGKSVKEEKEKSEKDVRGKSVSGSESERDGLSTKKIGQFVPWKLVMIGVSRAATAHGRHSAPIPRTGRRRTLRRRAPATPPWAPCPPPA